MPEPPECLAGHAREAWVQLAAELHKLELHQLQPGSGKILDTHGDTVAIIPLLLLRLAIKH
jgi:hypothetical protein